MQDTPIFQVSELNEAINHHLSLLGEVVVEGEISRFDINKGRLIFATIKDSDSSMDVFSLTHIIRSYSQFEPGMLVQVHAEPGLYKGSGKFRLFAKYITPVGEGSLQIAFEKLKNKLESEGLFDISHKRELPQWPQNIGVITAKDSSAYFDTVKILTTRMPIVNIKHLPVTVQGRTAPSSVKKALTFCNAHPELFDLLILTRGGGSLEDLAAFNDEEVARAVFASKVPIISAIGHEDDVSLTDYVADLRASTPSNAAELAVKDRKEVISTIDAKLRFTKNSIHHAIKERSRSVNRLIETVSLTITELTHSVEKTVTTLKQHIRTLHTKLAADKIAIDKTAKQAKIQLTHRLFTKNQDVLALDRLLHSLDYKNVLKRGYSITRSQDGEIIKDAASLKIGESITSQFAKGSTTAKITKI